MTEACQKASALIFGAGILVILVDVILFLFDWSHAGIAFCIGLGTCGVSALLSERAKLEDVVTILVAVATLGLVVVRSL